MAWRTLPIVALCGTAALFAYQCLVLMQSVGDEQVAATSGLGITVLGVIACAVTVVLVEGASISRRFRGPEYRVRLAMQRIRAGDVGFRISLRRGDPLTGLAHECNELLEWLNANPPTGVRVGGDIVDLAVDDDEGAQ